MKKTVSNYRKHAFNKKPQAHRLDYKSPSTIYLVGAFLQFSMFSDWRNTWFFDKIHLLILPSESQSPCLCIHGNHHHMLTCFLRRRQFHSCGILKEDVKSFWCFICWIFKGARSFRSKIKLPSSGEEYKEK